MALASVAGRRRKQGAGLLAACVSLLAGCTPQAAPSLGLFGAYFPAWLLCGLIGIVGALVAWRLMVAWRLSGAVPAQRLACCAFGLIVACLAWWWRP